MLKLYIGKWKQSSQHGLAKFFEINLFSMKKQALGKHTVILKFVSLSFSIFILQG